jgi:hypothetical protein
MFAFPVHSCVGEAKFRCSCRILEKWFKKWIFQTLAPRRKGQLQQRGPHSTYYR